MGVIVIWRSAPAYAGRLSSGILRNGAPAPHCGRPPCPPPHLGDPGIAIGGVSRGLFVAHQDVAQLRIGPKSVVEGKNRPAGMAEDNLDALPEQAFADDFRTPEFHCNLRSRHH